MSPRLLALTLVCSACADADDAATTNPATNLTTAATATAPAVTTSGETTLSVTTSGADTTAADDTTVTPSTTTTSASTTAAPLTTTEPATTDPATTTGDGSTGAPVDPLACPPELPLDCSPGRGSGEPDTCAKGTSCFVETIKQSVQDVIAANPAWFTDEGGGSYLVLDLEAYMNAVVAAVGQQDVCAIRDPNAGDEIAVKHDNGYAESFDILTADNHARYGDGIYTATCAPAWF